VTLSRREIRELLAQHGVRPNRALGQHFVADPNTVRRVARLAEVGPGDAVVEVGAGVGSLTLALAETGATVTAIELDRRLVPILRALVEPVGVTVVEGDAMRLPWPDLLGDGSWALVANLPYNVATPLILDLLDTTPAIARMLVMVQREVGERLAARPGGAAYGAVSVKVAYWATVQVVGRVPANVFVPRPKVESVLVAIRRRPVPAVPDVDRERLFQLVRAAFGQRRKMLRSSLSDVVGPHVFEAAGIPDDARPEDVDVEAWGRLTRVADVRRPDSEVS
jgi:16S rRNA (adenine1518-N6/adenine1519-N6)-dimethyltransferase